MIETNVNHGILLSFFFNIKFIYIDISILLFKVEYLINRIDDDPSLKGDIIYYIDYILSMIEHLPNDEIERSPSYFMHTIFYFISFLNENNLTHKCMDCYDAQFKIMDKINAYEKYPDIVLETYDHYGHFFLNEKDYSNAIKYFKEYISFSNDIKSNFDDINESNILKYDFNIAKGYGFLSITYLSLFKTSLFQNTITKMKEITDNILSESNELINDELLYHMIYFNIDIYSQISMIYYDRKKVNESINYLEKAYQFCLDNHNNIKDSQKKKDILELSNKLLMNIQSIHNNMK